MIGFHFTLCRRDGRRGKLANTRQISSSVHTHVNPYPLPPCRTAERGWCITIHHHPERGCRIFVRHHQHRNTHDPSPFHGVRISSSDHHHHRIPRRTADLTKHARMSCTTTTTTITTLLSFVLRVDTPPTHSQPSDRPFTHVYFLVCA